MKTVCVYHRVDNDGWMSAAIVKHWFEEKQYSLTFKARQKSNSEIIPDTLDFVGYHYGDPIPDLSEYDKVIMCDISFPSEDFLKLYNQVNTNITVIDHHISAINELQELIDTGNIEKSLNGLRDTNFAACELTWFYFFPTENIPEIVRLLGMYDSFRHKTKSFDMTSDGYSKAKRYLIEIDKLKEFESNNTSTDGYSLVHYANDVAKRLSEEQKVLEFQYGARQVISNYEEAYNCLIASIENKSVYGFEITEKQTLESYIHKKGIVIYQYLCTEAKQVYKNGFPIRIVIPGPSPTYKFICINKERFNPINFGIDYHAEGYDGAACFWYSNGKWQFSLYNDNGKVDCSKIAKQFGGGGHVEAAGFVCDTEQLLKIIT